LRCRAQNILICAVGVSSHEIGEVAHIGGYLRTGCGPTSITERDPRIPSGSACDDRPLPGKQPASAPSAQCPRDWVRTTRSLPSGFWSCSHRRSPGKPSVRLAGFYTSRGTSTRGWFPILVPSPRSGRWMVASPGVVATSLCSTRIDRRARP